MFNNSLNKTIFEIVEESDSNRIAVITNQLKIDGFVYKCEGRCKEISENILTLRDATVCNLTDYCICDEEDECECNEYTCFKYDWLNVALSQIVAFSVIK